MPQRFLRPGITNSELWNAVDPMAGNLFIRLLTLVDDFGRTDGRTSVIMGHCFAVWNVVQPKRSVKLQQVAAMLGSLQQVGMIDIYEAEGKRVLQIQQWQERIREGCKARWPEKPKLAASCSKLLPPPPSSTPPPTPASTPAAPHELRYPANAGEEFKKLFERWVEFRKGLGKKPKNWTTLFQEQLDWLEHQPAGNRREIVSQSIRNGWQGLFEIKRQTGARPENIKPPKIDKIELPERFKSWVAEHYPDRREVAMKWRTWADVPNNGLRNEWWTEEKKKLPGVGSLI